MLRVISFRPVAEADFPLLTRWLAEPHVRAFYQKTPVTLEDVAAEYGAAVRGEEPTLCHLALLADTPFAYLQCYRNAAYPEWAALIGVAEGVSIDLYIGEPRYLHRGLGRLTLRAYSERIALPFWRETIAYIAHEPANRTALACSRAVGFEPLRLFLENEVEMQLLEWRLALC